jgi:signal transduction histidine kinase
MRGLPARFAEFVREPRIRGPKTGIARLTRGELLVHFADAATVEAYEAGDSLIRASVDLCGFRTILVVPLRKDASLLGGFTIELVPQDITRVFLNLFGDGFYAAAKRQRDGAEPDFRPALKVATRDLGEAVEIRVRDNGIGIPDEIKDKLFQPFFTTKPTGEGTGLGLSISGDIVTQQHGGTIEVDSRVVEFTEFAIRLPRARQATIAAEAAA